MEIEGLFEIGRISARRRDDCFAVSYDQIGLTVSEAAFLDVVEAARSFAWTREPFDRLIVANAMADGVRLLTADEMILRHFKDAVW